MLLKILIYVINIFNIIFGLLIKYTDFLSLIAIEILTVILLFLNIDMSFRLSYYSFV